MKTDSLFYRLLKTQPTLAFELVGLDVPGPARYRFISQEIKQTAFRLDGLIEPPAAYPENELSYLGNVLNSAARAFYAQHGVTLIADAYETNTEKGEVSLMITRHCLRYSFNLCPKEVKGIRPDPMTLVNGKEKLTLRFDCKKCEMHVVGKLRKGRQISITPVAH